MAIIYMSYQLNTGFPSRQIYIQSGNADYNIDSIGNCVYDFNDIIIVPDHITILMSLVDAQIPMSYYAINSNNYTLDYTESSVSKSYQLDEGNTDAITLKNDLTTNLTNITCSYSSITNKYTFTSTGSFSIDSSSTCLKLLGLSETTHTSSDVSGTQTIVSDNCIDLSGTKSIYMITQLGNYNLDSRTGNYTQVFTKIPVDTGGNGILKYTNKTLYKTTITQKHITYLHIKLEDDDRNIIDFNGVNYSLTLQVDFIETIQYKHIHNGFNMIENTEIRKNIKEKPKKRGRPKGSKNKN